MAKTLGETCVDSLRDLEVFGGDAKVVEFDLEFPFGEVFDLKVFALVFFVVVVRRDKGVICRRRGFARGVDLLLSASIGFLLRCHVVVSERTMSGRQNYWWKIPFGEGVSQQLKSSKANPQGNNHNHSNGTKINAMA